MTQTNREKVLELSSELDQRSNDMVDIVASEALKQMIKDNSSLRSMLQGSVGEYLLEERILSKIPAITDIQKPGDRSKDRKSDRNIIYHGELIKIQCKSIAKPKTRKVGDVLDSAVYIATSNNTLITLPNGETIRTKYVQRDAFDILAVSTFMINRDPDGFIFKFAKDCGYPDDKTKVPDSCKPFFITRHEPVSWPLNPAHGWSTDIVALLDQILEERQSTRNSNE